MPDNEVRFRSRNTRSVVLAELRKEHVYESKKGLSVSALQLLIIFKKLNTGPRLAW